LIYLYLIDGEYILVEGDTKDTNFYMLEEGVAIATKVLDRDQDEDEFTERKPVEVKRYSAGDFFGELALMTNQPRGANVVAVGPVRCITLDRDSFVRILGPYEDVLKRSKKSYVKEEFKVHQQKRAEKHQRAPPSLNMTQTTSGGLADDIASQQVTPHGGEIHTDVLTNNNMMNNNGTIGGGGHGMASMMPSTVMTSVPHHHRSSSGSVLGHHSSYLHASTSPMHHHAHSMSMMTMQHPSQYNSNNGMMAAPSSLHINNGYSGGSNGAGSSILSSGYGHPVHKSFDYSMNPPLMSPLQSYAPNVPPPSTPPALSHSMEQLHDEATGYQHQQPSTVRYLTILISFFINEHTF
jgi:hypothetical protein